MKRIFYLLSFLILRLSVNAQDPHFSQPNLAAVFINPAFVGVMDGNYRLSVMYRTQWFEVIERHPYLTYAAAFDWRLCENVDGAWLGFGLKMTGDKAGFAAFERYHVAGNLAGHIDIGRNNYLSIGLEMGGLFYKVGYSDLRFDAQFNGEDYIASLPNMENFNEEQLRGKLDVSGGIMLFNPKKKFYAGLGFFHLNTPDYILVNSNIPSNSQVDIKWVGHIAYQPFTKARKFSFNTNLVIQNQGNFWQVLAGTGVDLHVGYNRVQSIIFNIFNRIGRNAGARALTYDAAIFQIKYEIQNIAVGISYDFNFSSLRKASAYQGAFELGMTYRFKEIENDCVNCFKYHRAHVRDMKKIKRWKGK